MAVEIINDLDQILATAGELPKINRGEREEQPLPDVFEQLLPKLKDQGEGTYAMVVPGITKNDGQGQRHRDYTEALTTVQRWNRKLQDEGFRASVRSVNPDSVAIFVGYDPAKVAEIMEASKRRSDRAFTA